MRQMMNLTENVQLAQKIYGSGEKLSKEDFEYIMSVTHGDATTKALCDVWVDCMENLWRYSNEIRSHLPEWHQFLKNYNQNVFPIKDFDMNNSKGVLNLDVMKKRKKLMDAFDKLPSVAVRNLRPEIRQPRTWSEFDSYLHLTEYFMAHFSLLSNRNDEMKQIVYNKMFKAGSTMKSLVDFVEEKSNLLGGGFNSKDEVLEVVRENHSEELQLVLDHGDVLVVEVTGPEGIKEIGCTATWCFTYGQNNWRDWNNYSTNSVVYVIVDTSTENSDPEFMYVLIGPLTEDMLPDPEGEEENDNTTLYDAANMSVTDPYGVLTHLVGKQNLGIFSFEPVA
jgi:hypothetical protein